jgi:hypothetical protein
MGFVKNKFGDIDAFCVYVCILILMIFPPFFMWKLQVVVKPSNIYPKDAEAPPCGVDDMTKLAYLHEPGVLENLRSRYDINEIYVSI